MKTAYRTRRKRYVERAFIGDQIKNFGGETHCCYRRDGLLVRSKLCGEYRVSLLRNKIYKVGYAEFIRARATVYLGYNDIYGDSIVTTGLSSSLDLH